MARWEYPLKAPEELAFEARNKPVAADQAPDRAHRIGQTHPVTIYRLVAKGTIEERIVALYHHKSDLAERLLESADAPAWLDAGELLELLRRPMG